VLLAFLTSPVSLSTSDVKLGRLSKGLGLLLLVVASVSSLCRNQLRLIT